MIVQREDAIRALSNAILFSDAKSEAAGLIAVEAGGDDRLYFTASDDFVIIQDSTPYTGQVPEPFWLDLKMAKETIKTLNESKSEQSDLTLLPPAEAEWSDEFAAGINAMLNPNFFEPHVNESDAPTFAVRPSRFTKFGRIKTTDDYPIDFIYGEIWVTSHFNRNVLKFKVGPHTHGVLAPVLRSTLAEEFADEAKAVLW